MLNSKAMETLNRIELRGMVGAVRTRQIQGQYVVNFSLATEYSYKPDKDRDWVKETTWHNITWWSKSEQHAIMKGVPVHVIGRLRSRKYIGQDNVERPVMEVIASNVAVLVRDTSPQPSPEKTAGKSDVPF